MSLLIQTIGAWRAITKEFRKETGTRQSVDLYFDPKFAELLEVWAVDSAWREIGFLLSNRKGNVLDLACGTGRAFDFLKDFDGLEYHGCDLSKPLIDRAIARGIPANRLRVEDAIKLGYVDGEFDYVFSIGSLEHFTLDGLRSTLRECRRVCRGVNFHQVPVSKSNFNEGWIAPYQSYWNNSEQWWIEQFEQAFGKNVWVMNSKWEDDQSRGAWFVCVSA